MALKIDNNAFELSVTPSRKRKREFEKISSEGLTNPSFSLAQNNARSNVANKENISFIGNPCLEEKSISEIALQKSQNTQENLYEVARKPPKKKKKSDLEKACFVNPALNLNVPEKRFNPFEVKRPSPQPKKTHCFVNEGLNIRIEDNKAGFNPFEISRDEQIITDLKQGIENPALEIPKSIAIALPFTPTVGCRIDFSKIPLGNLTPSKLLEEKLVFSPAALNVENGKFRRSLSVISEEIDIGKELDCYQLELENSINEAKFRKSNGITDTAEKKKSKLSFGSRLEEIEEADADNVNLDSVDENASSIKSTGDEDNSENISTQSNDKDFPDTLGVEVTPEIKQQGEEEKKDNKDELITEKSETKEETKKGINEDESDVDEFIDADLLDDDDFKKPAPFVRCYRKAGTVKPNSNNQLSGFTQTESRKEKKTVTNVIRKSFRNIIHSVKNHHDEKLSSKDDKQHKTTNDHHFFETIRQSLRIKKIKQQNSSSEEKTEDKENFSNISILDNSERKIFRSNSLENITPKQNINKKLDLRGSLRRSSKRVKNHIYKTLKKNTENYDFKKE